MAGKLILAVPSKGRLEENAQAFFARAGLKLARRRGERDYRGHVEGVDGIEVAYLAASEIARELGAGKAHLGVTGEDLIHETIPDVEGRILTVTRLGFGEARVVVAVPRAWIDVDTMGDLDEVASSFRARHGRRLRVATKYIRLARAFFANHDVGDYRIVESLGATEGAPAAGTAECIVDITTSGQTLAANALKVLNDGEILKSEASLFASRMAVWTDETRAALKLVCARIAAQANARRLCEVRFSPALNHRELTGLARDFAAVIAPDAAGEGVLHVPEEQVFAVVNRLQAAGADLVSVSRLDYLFLKENPLWQRLEARL